MHQRKALNNLLRAKQIHYPDQPIDWDHLLDEFLSSSHHSFGGRPFQEKMQFLVMCGFSERVEALPFKIWRDHITNMIHTANFQYNGNNNHKLGLLRAKVAHFEDEYPKLKEITTILELALWKLKMNENIIPQEKAIHCQKKVKTDKSTIRGQCRITCGADVVIRHVLPWLITVVD